MVSACLMVIMLSSPYSCVVNAWLPLPSWLTSVVLCGAGAAALGQVVGAALVGDEDVVGAVLVEVQLVVGIGLGDRGFVAGSRSGWWS